MSVNKSLTGKGRLPKALAFLTFLAVWIILLAVTPMLAQQQAAQLTAEVEALRNE